MQFQTFPIEAALRPYLVRIWAFRGVLPLDDLRLIAPSGEMKLILPFHGAPTSTTRGISYRHAESSCSIVGQLTSPSTISAVGAIGMLGVTFKPAGARCFLGLPLAEIAESVVSSGDLPGSDWDDLASRVAETAAITTKVRKVQEFLIRSLQRGDVDHRALDLAVREIELSRGVIRIHDLSDRVGWTRRHGRDPSMSCTRATTIKPISHGSSSDSPGTHRERSVADKTRLADSSYPLEVSQFYNTHRLTD